MGSFGNKFRKARESKKLSLDDVSNVTKISSRMLKAIEEEDFDQLPGGVFNKGFIRTYAQHLGLDQEAAITDYLACLRQGPTESREGSDSERRSGVDRRKVTASTATALKKTSNTETSVGVEDELPHLQLPRAEDIRSKPKEYLDRPSSGFPWLTIAVVLVIASAGALFWVRHSRRTLASKAAAPAVAIETPVAPTPVVLPRPVSAQTTLSTPGPGVEPQPASAKSQNGTQAPTSTHSAAGATPAPANSSLANNPADADSLPAPSPKPVGKLTLVIRASENSWISVAADGQTITQETLIAPAHLTAHANREITVRLGNAAGVTFTWNGQEIPAQGSEAEVKTLVFDADGMHSPVTTPN